MSLLTPGVAGEGELQEAFSKAERAAQARCGDFGHPLEGCIAAGQLLGLVLRGRVGGLELVVLLGELEVLLLDLAVLFPKSQEHAYLRPQQGRVIGLVQIIKPASLITGHEMLRLTADRGQEDYWHVPAPFALAYEPGGLEAVHFGHLHVQNDDGEVAGQQLLQCFEPRARCN